MDAPTDRTREDAAPGGERLWAVALVVAGCLLFVGWRLFRLEERIGALEERIGGVRRRQIHANEESRRLEELLSRIRPEGPPSSSSSSPAPPPPSASAASSPPPQPGRP